MAIRAKIDRRPTRAQRKAARVKGVAMRRENRPPPPVGAVTIATTNMVEKPKPRKRSKTPAPVAEDRAED